MNISNCSLKDECQFVKELKDKISNMQESYETDAEAKFYDYLGEHENELEKEQLNNLVNSCQEEIRQLKKQLEEADRKLFFTKNELDMRQKSIDNKLTQQKEFIKYLEDMLDDENDIFSVVRVKDALQKYIEITGVSDEKES